MSPPTMESPPPSQSLADNTALAADTESHLGLFVFDCSRDDESPFTQMWEVEEIHLSEEDIEWWQY
ncbi:hypothetical protein C2S52_008740 [Perilla frutescens var. hirtella]|nr:hypothetical protein C2S52_008740 [Perilla frutescens var. hirtella]